MSSVCISNCINDARDPRVPVRATYVNLYKWPESEAEFVRSVKRGGGPRVVDSISCRQMYLRSYTFSREEDHKKEEKKKSNKTQCFGRIKETASCGKKKKDEDEDRNDVAEMDRVKRRRRRKRTKRNGNKKMFCSALFRFFNRLLSCAATVDVVDQKDY